MPTVRIELEDADIRAALQKLGYGFHLDRRFAMCLTVADTSVTRASGHHARKQLAPISEAKYDRIRKYCESTGEAVSQIVKLSHGQLTDPDLPAEHAETGGGVDTATMQAIVKSAVANELDKATAPLRQKVAEQGQQVEALREENRGLRARAEKLLAKGSKKKGRAKEPEPVQVPDLPKSTSVPLDEL